MAYFLITGAAGFIASRVADKLLSEGHDILGVDDLNDAYDVRLKEYRLARLNAFPRFHFIKADISDPNIDDSIKFDAVFNLAARAGVRAAVENPWVFIATNTTGTLNMLEFCRQRQVPKLILASTSSIYGKNAPLPTPETSDSDHPLQQYAASKKGAEALCYAYHHLYHIDITIFRYFTVYGPAGRPDMVMFRFIQWIFEEQPVRLYGDGEQSRGFTYVDDIAEGTIAGLKRVGYEIINLGGHESITIFELIRHLENLIGKKAKIERLPLHPADMLSNLADVSKARSILEWEPNFKLAQGMQQTVDWYRSERSWAKFVQT
jgi:UDP-glucuronate 4-epimerase